MAYLVDVSDAHVYKKEEQQGNLIIAATNTILISYDGAKGEFALAWSPNKLSNGCTAPIKVDEESSMVAQAVLLLLRSLDCIYFGN